MAAAAADDPDDVRESILTGYKTGKAFIPYAPTIALPPSLGSVLDFGCGLGRNFSFLKNVARFVCGYDLPPMVERCRELATTPVDLLTAEWADVVSRRFDLVFTSLVLQHIEVDTIRALLSDFARLAPACYVLSRARSDFGVNVFELVGNSGLFALDECVEVDHDPSTAGLRVLGRTSLEYVSATMDNRHYESLMRSKVFHQI